MDTKNTHLWCWLLKTVDTKNKSLFFVSIGIFDQHHRKSRCHHKSIFYYCSKHILFSPKQTNTTNYVFLLSFWFGYLHYLWVPFWTSQPLCVRLAWHAPRVTRLFAVAFHSSSMSVLATPFLASQPLCVCTAWNAPRITCPFVIAFHPCSMSILVAPFLTSQPLCVHPIWNALCVARPFEVAFHPCSTSVLAAPFLAPWPLQPWWLSDNLVYLGERIPKSNEHTEIIGEVLEFKIKWFTHWGSNLS
jgi:hypothetical protein